MYICMSNHKLVVRVAYFYRKVADACGNYRQLPREAHPVSELGDTRDRTVSVTEGLGEQRRQRRARDLAASLLRFFASGCHETRI